MKGNISIQKLETKDAVLLSKVAVKAYVDHYLHLWYDDGAWYIQKCFTVDQLSVELSDKNAAFYLANFNDEPVGFLKLNINAPFHDDESKNALELERIYLPKAFEGKGLGKAMVQLTFDVAKENDKEIVWLKAMDTSDGPIAFYEKMGFEICGTHRLKHPLMKEEFRGMVIMKKDL